jgi:surface antigen
VGFGGPWCHHFQEWVADRAGLGSITGWYGPYFRYQNHLRTTMTKTNRPQVGGYILMSVSADFSHTAFIVSVSSDGNTFTVIEGNWGHGVKKTTMTRSQRTPHEYYLPNY